jgi:methylase of polypeptide subunit release factors
MITVPKSIKDASTRLEAAGIPTARLDASLLLADVLATEREKLLLSQDSVLKSKDIEAFDRAVGSDVRHMSP